MKSSVLDDAGSSSDDQSNSSTTKGLQSTWGTPPLCPECGEQGTEEIRIQAMVRSHNTSKRDVGGRLARKLLWQRKAVLDRVRQEAIELLCVLPSGTRGMHPLHLRAIHYEIWSNSVAQSWIKQSCLDLRLKTCALGSSREESSKDIAIKREFVASIWICAFTSV